MTPAEQKAERMLLDMLKNTKISVKSAYYSREVCLLLGINRNTLNSACDNHVEGTAKGIESFRTNGGHRRITYGAMVRYLANHLSND